MCYRQETETEQKLLAQERQEIRTKYFFRKQSIKIKIEIIFGTKVSLAVMSVECNSQALSSSRYPADKPLTGGQVRQLTSDGQLSSKLTQRRTTA